jgi:hypothetical protein
VEDAIAKSNFPDGYLGQLQAWCQTQEEKYLLRGEGLAVGLAWAEKVRVREVDTRFLTASQTFVQRQLSQEAEMAKIAVLEAQQDLVQTKQEAETARLAVVEAQQNLERTKKRIKIGSWILLGVGGLAVVGLLSAITAWSVAQSKSAEASQKSDEVVQRTGELSQTLIKLGQTEQQAQVAQKRFEEAQQQEKIAKVQVNQAKQDAQAAQQQFIAAQQRVRAVTQEFAQVSQEKEVVTQAKVMAETKLGTVNQQLQVAQVGTQQAMVKQEQAETAAQRAQKALELAVAQLKRVETQRQTIIAVNDLEKEGSATLQSSKYDQMQESLLDAMLVGQKLQDLIRDRGPDGFTASPILALQSILDALDNRALQSWKQPVGDSTKLLERSDLFYQTLPTYEYWSADTI